MEQSNKRYFGKKYCWDYCERFCIGLRFVCPCVIYQNQIESIVVEPPSIGWLFNVDSGKFFENLGVSIREVQKSFFSSNN